MAYSDTKLRTMWRSTESSKAAPELSRRLYRLVRQKPLSWAPALDSEAMSLDSGGVGGSGGREEM